jgi:hypothetical protein
MTAEESPHHLLHTAARVGRATPPAMPPKEGARPHELLPEWGGSYPP